MEPNGVARKAKWLGGVVLLAAVASAAAEPPAPAPVRSELGVMIPMRDGVKLAADLWLPEAPGRYPVLLVRTPYMKTGFGLSRWASYFARRGYVFAIQDTRGYDREELLTPGKVESFRIELFDIAHRFAPGHRIRLEISSSAAPIYNPNQNTGNPVATDTEWRVAKQTIYHDRTRASSITLPVVRREQGR